MNNLTALSNFSLISRLFGNLFYRSPSDPVLVEVFAWLSQQNLTPLWLLETDKTSNQALQALQMPLDLTALDQEYHNLFAGSEPKVNTQLSAYSGDLSAFVAFREAQGLPAVESADHFALILLTAAWLEDHAQNLISQKILFEQFLLPCANGFLTQVETHASLPFYRALALLCREILAAMADELDETDNSCLTFS